MYTSGNKLVRVNVPSWYAVHIILTNRVIGTNEGNTTGKTKLKFVSKWLMQHSRNVACSMGPILI